MTQPRQHKRDIIPFESAETLCGLFRERVKRSADAIAYRQFNANTSEWEDTTWIGMQQAVIRWQQAMRNEQLRPGDRVAVMLKNSREWIMFDQAAAGLGIVTVPLYTEDRAENVAYILANAGVKLLLIGTREQWQELQPVKSQLGFLQRIVSVDSFEHNEPRLQSLNEWLPESAEGELQVNVHNPHSLASIVYTSGTTGRPKGVMLSHRNMLSNAFASQNRVNVYTDDVFLSFLPLSHTLERTIGYYLTLMCGATVAFNRSIPELADDLLAIRPTVLISVPRIFERVHNKIHDGLAQKSPIARKLFKAAVDVGWHRFEYQQGRAGWRAKLLLWPLLRALVAGKVMAKLGGRMRFAVVGGAPLPPAVAHLFIGLGLPLVQGYGLTETSPVIGANSVMQNIPESIGYPLEDIEVRIGENDELLVRGPNIMLGYWDNPEATAAIIDSEGWLHTGDKARIDDKGHIYITGRIKEIIVMANGEKVPPADMEMAIAFDSLFDQVMVLGDNRSFLSAIAVLNPDQWTIVAKRLGVDPEDHSVLGMPEVEEYILGRIAERIKQFPGYAQVRRVSCTLHPWNIETGLITPTLKLKRNKIEDYYSAQIEAMYEGH